MALLDRLSRTNSGHPGISRPICAQRRASRILLQLPRHKVICASYGREKEASKAFQEGSKHETEQYAADARKQVGECCDRSAGNGDKKKLTDVRLRWMACVCGFGNLSVRL